MSENTGKNGFKARPSAWRAQLGALGLDVEAAREPRAAGEAERLAAVRLPALELPPEAGPAVTNGLAKKSWRRSAVISALALAALVVVLNRPREDVLTPKGGAVASVWWERGGQVQKLTKGIQLQNGDRVRAEVKSPKAGRAVWLVVDAQRKPLVSADFVAASEIAVAAQGKVPFAKSIMLEGEAVGETLVIVSCEGIGLSRAEIAELLESGAASVPGRCGVEAFRLR